MTWKSSFVEIILLKLALFERKSNVFSSFVNFSFSKIRSKAISHLFFINECVLKSEKTLLQLLFNKHFDMMSRFFDNSSFCLNLAFLPKK